MPIPSSDRPLATPLVSIVTPAYNQADFLAETIESVLAQDYPRLEYIVLDDGSTDATPEVLAKYTDRIIWQRHENMGQSRTLNKGWRMARGDIVGYLSSDDRLLPGAISAGVAALAASPTAIVSYCDFELIDARSRRSAPSVPRTMPGGACASSWSASRDRERSSGAGFSTGSAAGPRTWSRWPTWPSGCRRAISATSCASPRCWPSSVFTTVPLRSGRSHGDAQAS